MSNHYSDFEELRPTGEASHIPDEQAQPAVAERGKPDDFQDMDEIIEEAGEPTDD